MIDHVLGRPSVQFRKMQVLAVVSFWSVYLYRGDRHGPPLVRRLSSLLSPRLSVWQTVLVTLLYLYVARNFGKLVGLESPEPLASLYSPSYFRATWVTTALDAGFWSAMKMKRKGVRDMCSIVFSLYYLVCAEQADEKVRKIRSTLTVDHLRVSWNKGTTPYLAAVTRLMRPRLMWYPPRKMRIARPKASSYTEPVVGWLYFNGPLSALQTHDKIVLDVPGGGFVAMDPRTHDDKLMGWAAKTGLPVLSLDYRKAPEYPYPYALNECYDVYHAIVATRGRCMGLSGATAPKIVVAGDSAGGNLAVAMVLMVLQAGSTPTRRWQGEHPLPPPVGCMLVYPALDMNIGNWMTDEQMALIRDRRTRQTNRPILRHKSDDYRHLAPNTPYGSDDESEDESMKRRPDVVTDVTDVTNLTNLTNTPPTHVTNSPTVTKLTNTSTTHVTNATVTNPPTVTIPPTVTTPSNTALAIKTRLATSSMISYFNDRILTPEMMRAMIILYIGPHHRPDFSTDFLLCPCLAPDSLLAKFPRTWMLTGERDPLVDDTVIFAGRLRSAKRADFTTAKELGLDWARGDFREQDCVNVDLVPGISHGFLQFVGVFPDGWKYIYRCARWIESAFAAAEGRELPDSTAPSAAATPWTTTSHADYFGPTPGLAAAVDGLRSPSSARRAPHHHRSATASSADEDRPLEMTVLPKNKANPCPPHQHAHATAGLERTARGRARAHKTQRSRRKSLVSLASEDDLLGRRMKGLTGGLRGEGLLE